VKSIGREVVGVFRGMAKEGEVPARNAIGGKKWQKGAGYQGRKP